jgi:hypothetical protein
MHDECRHCDLREPRPRVQSEHVPKARCGDLRGHRLALKAGEVVAGFRVGVRHEDVGDHLRAEPPERLDEPDERVLNRIGRELAPVGVCAVEREPGDELWSGGCERDRRATRARCPEEGCRPQVDGLQDRGREGRLLRDAEFDTTRGRETGPRPVVPQHRVPGGEALDPTAERHRLPLELEMAYPPAPEQERRAVADAREGHAAMVGLEKPDPLLHPMTIGEP